MALIIFSVVLSVLLMVFTIMETLILRSVKKPQVIINFVNILIGVFFLMFAKDIEIYNFEKNFEELSVISMVFNSYFSLFILIFIIIFFNKFKYALRQQKYYRLVVNSVKNTKWNIFYIIDRKDRIIDISTSLLEELGRTRNEVYKRNVFTVFEESIDFIKLNGRTSTTMSFRHSYKDYENHAKENQATVNHIHILNYKSKEIVIKFTETPIFLGGEYRGRMVIGEKRSEQTVLEVEKELVKYKGESADIRTKFVSLLELLDDGVYIRSDVNNYVWLTDNMKESLRLNRNSLSISDFEKLIHEEDYATYKSQVASVNRVNKTYQIKYRIKVGNRYLWSYEKGKMVLEEGKEQIIATNKLMDIASDTSLGIDMPLLSDLNNDMNNLIERNKGFALFVMNLPDLQRVNEKHGYDVGNKVLVEYAKTLLNEYSYEDTQLYYIKGASFGLLVSNQEIFNKIDDEMRTSGQLFNKEVTIAGIEELIKPISSLTICPTNVKTTEELLKVSQTLIEEAKRLNKNYIYYEDVIEEV